MRGVLMEGVCRWTTASADSNIITASMNALVDGLEYMLEHRNTFVEREN